MTNAAGPGSRVREYPPHVRSVAASRRSFGVIRNARRQAGRRFIPDGHARFARSARSPACRIGVVRGRTADAELARRLTAPDDSRRGRRHCCRRPQSPAVPRQSAWVRVEPVFAVASTGWPDWPGYSGRSEFAGLNDFVAKAEVRGSRHGKLTMAIGVAGTVGRDRHGAGAEGCRARHTRVRAIDASAYAPTTDPSEDSVSPQSPFLLGHSSSQSPRLRPRPRLRVRRPRLRRRLRRPRRLRLRLRRRPAQIELERISVTDNQRLTASGATDLVAEIHVVFVNFDFASHSGKWPYNSSAAVRATRFCNL